MYKFLSIVILMLLLTVMGCSHNSQDTTVNTDANFDQANTNVEQIKENVEQTDVNVAQTNKVFVISTIAIINDWVKIVGGDRVRTEFIIPTETDAHTFQPSTRNVAKIADADAVLSVGLSFESITLTKLIDNTVTDKSHIHTIGHTINPIPYQGSHAHDEDMHHDEGDHDEDVSESLDPHFWFDVTRTILAVREITEILSQLDPESKELFQTRSEEYIKELNELDVWIKSQIANIPESNRNIVLSHDAFSYYSQRYGLKIVGTVLPHGTTDKEPTQLQLVMLLDTIKESGAKAIFLETTVNDKLSKVIAQEAGVPVVSGLLTNLLDESKNVESSSYIGMMEHNTLLFVESLK